MKKVFSIFLVASVLLVVLTGCGKQETLDMSLEDIITKVYEGFGEDELPSLANTEITKDNMAYYLGVDTIDFKEEGENDFRDIDGVKKDYRNTI